jgi:ferric-dicitrate binding protein FerR (iron transport regulator)
MTARSHGSDDVAASALGRLLHAGDEHRTETETSSELGRLLETVREMPAQRARPTGSIVALVAAVLMLTFAVVGFEWHRRANTGLTFAADGVPGRERVAIAAGLERAVDLAFSDGSVFDVEPAARLRVESSSAAGARLTLVEGKTVAHVVHRAQSRWSVSAGPFEVRVTGTRFGATWDAKRERLSVELYEGSVQVEGGGLTAPLAVRAGQRLEAGKGSGDWLLTSLGGPVAARATARPPEPVAQPGPDPVSAPAASASAGRQATSRDWPALLARADFAEVVEQADAMGVERCFATCSSGDLRVLADSARYLGRHSLAEKSLLALRKRSPNDGASAAFLLGRLEESHDSHEALSWYERSLREAPGGAYAAEATAGKMRLLLQSGGPIAAAGAAEQYLARFPSGIHAAQARDILSRSR